MYKLLTLGAVALTALSAQAAADDRFYVTPSVNYTLYDKGLDDEIGYGIAIGKPISDLLDLGAEFVYNEPSFVRTGRKTEYTSFAGLVRYYYDREMPFYLVGSLGYAEVTGLGFNNAKADGYEVGGGAGFEYPFTDYGIAFAAEYRYLYRGLSSTADIEANDHRVTLGLRIPLGEPASAPEPEPLPPPPEPLPPPAPIVLPVEPAIDLTQKEPIVLPGVQFDYDSARLTESSDHTLDAAVAALNKAPEVKVVVKGHTCDLGTDLYNVELSERRANAVRDYLVKQGIAADRLYAQGFGKTMPLADNNSPEGREKNRRVELQVVEEGACLTPAPAAKMDEKGCAVLMP